MLTYKIDTFEGPLDLLLTLLAKNKMSIADIQISVIFDQYMEYLEQMRRMDMEIAGEFIVMASELMLIKSRMLLPRQEPEEEDPRERLQRALTEYQRAKAAAAYLEEQFRIYSGRLAKETDEVSSDPTDLDPQDIEALKATLVALLSRKEQEAEDRKRTVTVNPKAKTPVVPISDGIRLVTRKLKAGSFLPFASLFSEVHSRSEAVAAFLAVLTLVKDGHVLLEKRVAAEPAAGGGSEMLTYRYEYYCSLNPEKEIPDDYRGVYGETLSE